MRIVVIIPVDHGDVPEREGAREFRLDGLPGPESNVAMAEEQRTRADIDVQILRMLDALDGHDAAADAYVRLGGVQGLHQETAGPDVQRSARELQFADGIFPGRAVRD